MQRVDSRKPSVELVETLSAPALRAPQKGTQQVLPLGQAIRKYPKVVGYVIGLVTGILLVGYDTVIVGTVAALPHFQKDYGRFLYGKWIIPATWLALWHAFGPIGSVIGGVSAGWFQDRVGRRWSLATGSLISAIGVAILYVSNLPADYDARRGVFLAGKTLQGLSTGFVLATIQTYISETVPIAMRGSALALCPTAILLGQLMGSVVVFTSSSRDTSKAYLIPIASQWPFSAVPFIMALLMPESPAHLIRRDLMDAAWKASKRLYTNDIAAEVYRLKASIEHERLLAAEATYIACFRGSNLRRTGIVVFTGMIPMLFGLPLLSQASYFMQVVGMSASNSLIFLILGIALGLIGNGIGVWLMSRVGRRISTFTSLAITTVLWCAMGVAGCWTGVVTIWYSSTTMMVITIICGMGAWPASTAISAEVSALKLRAKSVGIGVFSQMGANVIFSLVLPYVFNPDAGNLRAKTGFVMSGICGVATVVTWFYVPESKDRSVTELDKMFELGVPARGFKGWVDESDRGLDRKGLDGRMDSA